MSAPSPLKSTVWALPAASIPQAGTKVGEGGMLVTPELLQDYMGHESLLLQRAKQEPHCYTRFDTVRLCWLSRLEPMACQKALEDFRPCAREQRRKKLAKLDALTVTRRRELTEQSKVLEKERNGGE